MKENFNREMNKNGEPRFNGEILLCEDNEMIRQVVISHLERLGFDVFAACNGKEGVDMVSARVKSGGNPFGLILMDIQMPVMDGLEATGNIIAMGVKTPVVALSAGDMQPDDRKAYASSHGMAGYLGKPFEREELWACLCNFFTPASYEPVEEGDNDSLEENRLRKLFGHFVRRNQSTYGDICEALESGDIKLAHRLAHTLKGLAGLMGKEGLRDASGMVENALADGDAGNLAKKDLEALGRELKTALDELAPFAEQPKQVAAANWDKNAVQELLDRLERLLESDSAQCLGLIDELETIPKTGGLIQQLEDCEFGNALAELTGLRKSLGIPAESEAFSHGKENGAKRRILVVDDEVSNIVALCRILMPAYDVLVAKNGESAVEKAKKHKPDLILLDVLMSGMSGFEVIALLKATASVAKIPVIFITGLDSSEDEEKGFMLGAVDYITKPFKGSSVKARVRTHLQIIEYIEMVERLCKVDALTGIANRRSFDSQLTSEWGRAARDSKHLAVIMIDIDHFKKYNDTYGHPQGDALLAAVAAVYERSLNRSGDFVARYGGEEFVVLLPGSDLNGALEIAERIRLNIEDTVVPCADGTETRVTVSLGVNSEVPAVDRDAKDFLSMADQALYTAKNTGRNRVCAATGGRR